MITALKSVLMCSKVEHDDDGRANIIGLIGETLRADSKPGFVQNWVFIGADVDGHGSTGTIKLRAPSYSFAVPFEVPVGLEMAAFSLPILVPVLRASVLHIELIDDARRGKPFCAQWKLDFHPDPQVLGEEAGRSFIEGARENAEKMARSHSRKPSHGTTH
jgi:hypothetical protein